MADEDLSLPISLLPPAGPLTGVEIFPCVQSGQTRRTQLPNVTPSVAVFSGATVTATALSLPHDVSSIVTWQTVEGDTDGYFDPLSPTRLTAPFDGYYRVTAFGYAALSADSSTEIFIVENPGAIILGDGSSLSGPSFGVGGECNADGQTVRVTAGAYFQIHLFYDDGTDRNWTLRASIQYLGDRSTPPPPDLAFDDFVDADGTNLTSHTMPIGAGWQALNEVIEIWSDIADAKNSSNNTFARYATDVGESDYELSGIVVTLGSPAGDGGNGFLVRVVDNANLWYVDVVPGTGGNGSFRIVRRVANVDTVMLSALPDIANDTSYLMNIRCEGSVITAVLNGGIRLVWNTGGTFDTATLCGLMGRKHVGISLATRWRAFRVVPLS